MLMILLFLPLMQIFGCLAVNYFPPTPEGLTILNSPFHPEISISYKETFICETTPGVRSFSGYVHIHNNSNQQLATNTFFWFFESRKDPANAPLAIWFAGGPGASSIPAALGENGPCIVAEDSSCTKTNPWSWNNEVNILYIDQPVKTGFSYDILVNGTIDTTYSGGTINEADFSDLGVPDANNTFLIGTFSSQDPLSAVNSTQNAAAAVWNFVQAWFIEFPTHRPANNKISIWTESFGGHYGPAFAEYFEVQNDMIRSNTSTAQFFHLDTLGIINGFIDFSVQGPAYPAIDVNNTYGLKLITEDAYSSSVRNYTICAALTQACRDSEMESDPQDLGNNADVNEACLNAYGYCVQNVFGAFLASSRNNYDFGHIAPDPFPPKYATGYLNQHWVQKALGVPLNFTASSDFILQQFTITGDNIRGGYLDSLGYLLDHGVKVTLIYGDRDYQCNWLGGELVSLAINSTTSTRFHEAGYADIRTNTTYNGGVVRQHGNLSFSRVFEAGHQVPYYQPETAYRIFMRSMFNTDIATGTINTASNNTYFTQGPSSSFDIKNTVPESPKPVCYLWALLETCTDEQIGWLLDGSAVVRDFILVARNETLQ